MFLISKVLFEILKRLKNQSIEGCRDFRMNLSYGATTGWSDCMNEFRERSLCFFFFQQGKKPLLFYGCVSCCCVRERRRQNKIKYISDKILARNCFIFGLENSQTLYQRLVWNFSFYILSITDVFVFTVAKCVRCYMTIFLQSIIFQQQAKSPIKWVQRLLLKDRLNHP